jgi:hypothetical protein
MSKKNHYDVTRSKLLAAGANSTPTYLQQVSNIWYGTDGRIILRCIFRKWDVGVWTGSSWLRIGTGGGHL